MEKEILCCESINKKYYSLCRTIGNVGYNCYAEKDCYVWPFKNNKVPLNTKVIVPENTFGLLVNTTTTNLIFSGIIDNTYRKQLYVNVQKTGWLPRKIRAGEKLCQIIIIPYVECIINHTSVYPFGQNQ